MPRPRKPSPSTPCPSADRPATARTRQLFGHLGAISRLFGVPRDTDGKTAPRIHPRWGGHTSQMAREGATMMELSPAHFNDLPFTSSELLSEEAELRDLLSAIRYVAELSAQLSAHAIRRKNQLTEKVVTLEETVAAELQSPRTKAEERFTLEKVSAPFRAIRDERYQNMVATRRENQKRSSRSDEKVASVEADRDRLAAENEVLRGRDLAGSTIIHAAPTAPRRASRTRKTRR